MIEIMGEMPTTVNAAFTQFLKEEVNLDPEDTRVARSSRDWLINQIAAIPSRQANFPKLYPEVDIHYGSFARRTKIRDLDDIDLIVGISAMGSTYRDAAARVELIVPDGIALRNYCHDGTNLLNSRKVINLFIGALSDVPQYRNAELKRNGAAAVLDLTSYDWVFDIVPAFYTSPEFDGRTYYLIPDGNGYWRKTDPCIDQERVTSINRYHEGNLLNVIRVVKYWNRRATMPTVPSYLMECIVLALYANAFSKASSYVDLELPNLLASIGTAIFSPLHDPKGIDGDINNLSFADRTAIAVRANSDSLKAQRARQQETDGDHRQSISTWREIFGNGFPAYG